MKTIYSTKKVINNINNINNININKISLFTIKILSLSTALLFNTQIYAADTFIEDTKTGVWTFNYTNQEGGVNSSVKYVKQNLFKPLIKDSIKPTGTNNQFNYNYDITNHISSKQPIRFLFINQAKMKIKGVPVPPLPLNANDCKLPACDFVNVWLPQDRIYRTKLHTLLDGYLRTPKGWHGAIDLDDPVDNLSLDFRWVGTRIPVGQTIKGAGIVRPELPGVGLANMMGSVPVGVALGRPEGFPSTGPLNAKMLELEANGVVIVPVLAPAVIVPEPYNGEIVAQNLRAEVNQWVRLGIAQQPIIDRLNRQLDILIPALNTKNKPTARAAAAEIYKEIFTQHPTLTTALFNLDTDANIAQPINYKKDVEAKDQTPSLMPLNRVAARALGINITYIMTQLEAGK